MVIRPYDLATYHLDTSECQITKLYAWKLVIVLYGKCYYGLSDVNAMHIVCNASLSLCLLCVSCIIVSSVIPKMNIFFLNCSLFGNHRMNDRSILA